jgi:DNA topoisomerase-2
VLTFLEEEGMSIEPEWYAPILPMALVNGSAGIGTGWSSSIPNYNPRDLIKQVRHLLDGEPLDEINPWYRGFTGKMEPCVNPANPNSRRVTNNGLIEAHGALSVKITELPVGSWTAVYKSFLCGLRTTKKINDISEYHTDTKVNFIVSFTRAQMQALVTSKNSLRKFFKLDDAISLDNMVLFDPAGKVCRYNHVHDIIRDYFSVRLPLYEKRKRSQVRAFEYELKELANRMRFVLAVVTDELIVARKRKVVLIQELTDAGYWSKPKKTTAIVAADVADDAGIDDGVGVVDVDDDMDIDASDAGASASASASASAVDAEVEVGSGYDYLVGMPIWSLTDEKISKLQATADAKTEELRVLRATSPHDLWRAELLDLETALTGYERDLVKAEAEAEAEAAKDVASGKGGSGKVAGKGKGSGKGNKTAKGKAKMKAKAKGK